MRAAEEKPTPNPTLISRYTVDSSSFTSKIHNRFMMNNDFVKCTLMQEDFNRRLVHREILNRLTDGKGNCNNCYEALVDHASFMKANESTNIHCNLWYEDFKLCNKEMLGRITDESLNCNSCGKAIPAHYSHNRILSTSCSLVYEDFMTCVEAYRQLTDANLNCFNCGNTITSHGHDGGTSIAILIIVVEIDYRLIIFL